MHGSRHLTRESRYTTGHPYAYTDAPNPMHGLASAVVLFSLLVAADSRSQDQQDEKLPDDPIAALTKLPAQKPVPDGSKVRVVGPGGKPLVGASVVVVPPMRDLDRNRAQNLQRQAMAKYGRDMTKMQTAMFGLFGKRFVTDADGIANVPSMKQLAAVVATNGSEIGFGRPRGEQNLIEITLVPERPIHVLVVGPKGRPARGVPVTLVPRPDALWRATSKIKTDRKGRATIALGEMRAMPFDKIYVAVLGVTRKPVAHEIDKRKLTSDPDNPIKLTLPEFGRLHVQLLSAEGKSLPIDGATATIVGSSRRPSFQRFEADSVAKGSATFTVVETGLQLLVGCVFDGQARPQRVHTSGPDRHMGSKVITITGVTAPSRLTCRVLGLDGKPVVDEELGVTFVTSKSRRGSNERTDAEGRLSLVIPDSYVDDVTTRMIIVRRFLRGRRPGQYLGARELEIGKAKNKSLGDVQLAAEPLLVSGRVVDEADKPIAGATVRFPGAFPMSGGYGGSREFFVVETKSDSSGRFELRAVGTAPGPLSLHVSAKGGKLLRGATCDRGTEGHRVVMGRTQSILGRILGLRGATRSSDLKVYAQLAGDATMLFPRLSDNGDFEITGCIAGNYSISFQLKRPKVPFLTIDNIRVEAGKPCRDPRLANIDLSDHVRVLEIKVVDPDGKPAEATVRQFHVRGPDSYGGWGSSTRNGVRYVVVPKDGGNISVQPEKDEFRSQRFPLLKKDIVVTLSPGQLVRVKIGKLPPVPDSVPLVFRASRNQPGAGGGWGRHDRDSTMRVAKDGSAEFYAEGPGRYRLKLMAAIGFGTQLHPIGDGVEVLVDVGKASANGKTPQTEVTLDDAQREALEVALENAKKFNRRR